LRRHTPIAVLSFVVMVLVRHLPIFIRFYVELRWIA
jgi:hypothetical protein